MTPLQKAAQAAATYADEFYDLYKRTVTSGCIPLCELKFVAAQKELRKALDAEIAQAEPNFRELNPTLWAFFHQLIHGDFLADNPEDLSSTLAARQEVFEMCKTLDTKVPQVEPTGLRDVVATVCEGWTLPDDARKMLESALWSNPPQPQGEKS